MKQTSNPSLKYLFLILALIFTSCFPSKYKEGFYFIKSEKIIGKYKLQHGTVTASKGLKRWEKEKNVLLKKNIFGGYKEIRVSRTWYADSTQCIISFYKNAKVRLQIDTCRRVVIK